MSNQTSDRILAKLFEGDWTILRSSREDPAEETIWTSVQIEPADATADKSQPNKTYFNLQLGGYGANLDPRRDISERPQNNTFISFSNLAIDKNFNLTTCSDCLPRDATMNNSGSEEGYQTISVSYWRQSDSDIIFAFIGYTDSNPSIVFSARRASISSISPSPDLSFLNKPLKIMLTAGNQAAEGRIVVRSMGYMNDDSESFEPQNIYGIFNIEEPGRPQHRIGPTKDLKVSKSSIRPGEVERLYDLVVFAPSTRSFNSIFGTRSIAWDGQKHLFATFNNKSSLPSSHLPQDSSNRLGDLLPVERQFFGVGLSHITKRDVQSKSRNVQSRQPPEEEPVVIDPNDPDVGVWVGVPDN